MSGPRPRPPTGPRTWKRVSPEGLDAVRELLLRAGAVPDPKVTAPHERWRVRLGRAVFTGYDSGTVYCGGGDEPELDFLYGRLDGIA